MLKMKIAPDELLKTKGQKKHSGLDDVNKGVTRFLRCAWVKSMKRCKLFENLGKETEMTVSISGENGDKPARNGHPSKGGNTLGINWPHRLTGM
jgi:hypothetical protein